MNRVLNKVYLRISPPRYNYLKSILEGYDNLAVLSSVNIRDGIVLLRYSPGHEQDLWQLLSTLAARLR